MTHNHYPPFSGVTSLLNLAIFIEDNGGTADVFLSNTFSPNRDEINDLYKVSSSVEFSECQISIYNRWGGIVISNSDIEETGDGTINGKDADNGTYIFYAKLYLGQGKWGITLLFMILCVVVITRQILKLVVPNALEYSFISFI